MAEQLKQMQELLAHAIELSTKKEMEGNRDLLLKQMKEHPHFKLFFANINKKIDGKETPIHWALRRGITPLLFDALEVLSKEAADKEAKEQWKIVSFISSQYDFLKDVSDLDGSSLFLIAVQTGNVELVKHLIQKKADIFTANKAGMKALHVAAEAGNVSMVRFLIEELNLNPYEKDGRDRDIFYIAEVRGHKELLEYLKIYKTTHKFIDDLLQEMLKNQEDDNAIKKIFESDKIKYFAENINKKFNGLNIVQLALRMGANAKLLDKLIKLSQQEAYASKSYVGSAYDVINDNETQDGYALLHVAAKQGRLDIIDLLLKMKADINQCGKYTGRTPLLAAVKSRQSEAAAALLAYKPTEALVNILDRRKKSLLIWAIQQKQTGLIKTILEKSAQQAAFAKYNPIGYLLGSFDILTAGDERGSTPLHYAARYIQSIDLQEGTDLLSQLIKVLNEQGKTKAIDVADNLGSTPLHYAIMAGNLDAVKLLITKAKVNINSIAQGNHHLSPILLAAKLGNIEIVDYLISQKADVAERDSRQRGIFHQAILSGNEQLVQYLLNHQATKNLINDRDLSKRVPLHTAARLGQDRICQLIIEKHPNQLYELDKFNETPIRSAYRVARTHFHDMAGANLSVVDVLRKAMNVRMEAERKELAAQIKLPSGLDRHSNQFMVADQHQNLGMRQDLVTDLLQPAMNPDGTMGIHQVKILHEGKGFHCLVLVPTNIKDKEKINLNIVFCTPTQTKDILDSVQQLNKLESLKNNLGYVGNKIAEIIQQLKHQHPGSPVNLTVSGKGIGGDDAQYCLLSLMESIDKDKRFETVQDLNLVTINAPKVNKQISQNAGQLAQKLLSSKRLNSLSTDHLVVEGSLLPLIGDSYLLGDSQTSMTHVQYLRDKTHTQEMQRLVDVIQHDMELLDKTRAVLSKKENELYPFEVEFRKMTQDIAALTEKKQNAEHLQRRLEQLKIQMAPLEREIRGLRGEVAKYDDKLVELIDKLKLHENSSLNIDLNYGLNQEIIPKLQFSANDLSPVSYSSPGNVWSLGSFTIGKRSLDRNQAQNMAAIIHGKRPVISPVVFSTVLNGQTLMESKRKSEDKKTVEESTVYQELLKHVEKYRRGKSAFEQRYASGEYLYHHVAYQNLQEGDIVPVLSDQGAIENYQVHPIIQLRGMVSFALTPVKGNGEVKLLFRGTHDLDSAARDLSATSAGLQTFKGKERVVLNRINQIIHAERQRLRAEKLPEKISLSIGGHSLGATDAQMAFVLLQQGLAQNKYDKISKGISPEKEGKAVAESLASGERKRQSEEMLSGAELQHALGAGLPQDARNALDCITEMRLQAYNAPGVSDDAALQSLYLAQFLSQESIGQDAIKLRAYYQRVNADIVQRAGQAHILSYCPRKYAEVEVLKFLDYRSLAKLAAHTDKHFTRELSGRKEENLNPLCFESMQNDAQGKIINKDGALEFENKLEPTAGPAPTFTSEVYEVLKAWIASTVKSQFQEPSRGTGRRA